MSFNDSDELHEETGVDKAKIWDPVEETLSSGMTVIQLISLPDPIDFAMLTEEGKKVLLLATGAKTESGKNIYPLDILKWRVNKGLSVGVVRYGRHEYCGHRGYGWYVDCGKYVIGLWEGSDFEIVGSYLLNPELVPEFSRKYDGECSSLSDGACKKTGKCNRTGHTLYGGAVIGGVICKGVKEAVSDGRLREQQRNEAES